MRQFRVLVVDDEPRIINFLRLKLQASGYEVITAGDGFEALEQVQEQEPDLVVLDVLMPGMGGIETLEQIRALSSVPVIILSARGSNTDKISGLETGADDYLAKPFSPDELVARIEAVKRRFAHAEGRKHIDRIAIGNIVVDYKRRQVTRGGKDVKLTRIEWLLLGELSRNAGQLMMYEELLTRVWGPEYRNDVQLLRSWISRLRQKIEHQPGRPEIIRTVPKTGYMIEQPPAGA